jgi:phosphatidylserine/phosphatidylglycerophosphate/cardiolipin synthase-like enzyme
MSKRPGTALFVAALEPRLKDDAHPEQGLQVAGTIGELILEVQGFAVGEKLVVEFWERDDPQKKNPRADKKLATINATVAASKSAIESFLQVGIVTPDPGSAPPPWPVPPASGPKPLVVAFCFDPDNRAASPAYYYSLAADLTDQYEGDSWFIEIVLPDFDLRSGKFRLAHVRREVERKFATYRSIPGNTLTLFNDASTDLAGSDGAFKKLWDALGNAKKFIFIADWSFHALFRPIGDRQQAGTVDQSIGQKLIDWANANASGYVVILTWKHFGDGDSNNNDGDKILAALANGKMPKNLYWRASAHTTERSTFSHHQKFIVMDQPPVNGRGILRVFFGGLDLTKGRFDCPTHPIMRREDNCAGYLQTIATPNNKYKLDDWYNAEFSDDIMMPREPWHDIYGTVMGPAAWDFLREFVGRWGCDPGWWSGGEKPGWFSAGDAITNVDNVFKALFMDSDMRQQWDTGWDGPWVAQVYRSLLKNHWDHSGSHKLDIPESALPPQDSAATAPDPAASQTLTDTPQDPGQMPPGPRSVGHRTELQWSLSEGYEHSIQNAYRQAIRQAEKFIYIENQYFIGSGARWAVDPDKRIQNDIPAEIVKRILDRRRSNVPFHVYIIMPMYPEGSPVSVKYIPVRHYEWKTMEWMIQQLYEVSGPSWEDYLSFHFLANWHYIEPSSITAGSRLTRVAGNQRYMVYVHSKFMIIDDRYVLFGSANLNERSQSGNRDSEIACGFWPGTGREKDCMDMLQGFRKNLWQEHLGSDGLPGGWANPGEADCADAFIDQSDMNYKQLRACATLFKKGQVCRFPLVLDSTSKTLTVKTVAGSVDNSYLLPDAEVQKYDPGKVEVSQFWGWKPTGAKWYRSWRSTAAGTIRGQMEATE